MPKILLITDIFPPKIGGPATFIARLAEQLSNEQGYSVTVICTSDHLNENSDINKSYTVRRLYKRESYAYKIGVRQLLVKEILVHDCILVNGLESFVYPIAQTLRKSYISKVVGDSVWEMARNLGQTTSSFDEFQTSEYARVKFRESVEKRNKMLSAARYIVTPSNYLNHIVCGWGLPRDKVVTIHNGSDPDRFKQVQCSVRSVGPLRVLFVGRLTNWKGVETLLLAMNYVDNIQVTIVGDGPEYPHLFELAKQLNVHDRVDFAGRCTQSEVERQMSNAHVLVLTSLYEGMSHTVLEAMSSGLPCITSNVGGNAEVIISGKNGILIQAQNVRELVDALNLLEGNEELRQSMAEAAKTSSFNYSIGKTVQKYMDLLTRQTNEATR